MIVFGRIVVAAAESYAGGAVNEETIEGHAGATAYRAEEVRRAAVTDEAERVVIVVAADQGRPSPSIPRTKLLICQL